MSPQREQRLLDVLSTIQERGSVDRVALIEAIERRWGLSWATARMYVEDLIRRGAVISRFGILSLRFSETDQAIPVLIKEAAEDKR